MEKKKILWCVCGMMGMMLSGCAQKEEAKSLPVIRIALSSYQGRTADLNEISQAISEWTAGKIGCEVEILWQSSRVSSEYVNFSQKKNADIVFVGGKGTFQNYIERGLLLDMEENLVTYGKDILMAMDSTVEDLRRYGGVYGIPKPLHEIFSAGVMLSKEYVDKYQIDVSQIHHMEDMEPILEIIRQNEPDVTPIVANVAGHIISRSRPIGDLLDSCISMVRYDDPTLKVENYYATEEYEEQIRMLHRWQEKGYIDPEAIMEIEVGEDLVSSGTAFATEFVIRPDEVQYAKSRYQDKVQIIPFDEKPHYNEERDWEFVWTVSSGTQYPREAIEVLNLMYSDPVMINFLLYGIEGKHYIVKDDGTFAYPDGVDFLNVGYFNDCKWGFNRTIAGRWEGTSENIQAEMKSFNDSAITSYANGFCFDSSKVEQEITAVQIVLDKYGTKFGVGLLDVDVYYPKFLEELEMAGAQKILKEVQEQLDQWKKE